MQPNTQSESNTQSLNESIQLDSQQELDDVVASNDVVLADFYADWCGPCQVLEPIVETLAGETDATVIKVDVDSNQQIAAAYGVHSVPTLLLIHNGNPVEKIGGVRGKDHLRSLIALYTE